MVRAGAVIVALLACAFSFGQTAGEIRRYVKTVDSLRHAHKLQVTKLSMMSYCGGAVEGHYYKGKLVYISSYYGGELATYTSKNVYLRDTVAYKITYGEHFPEWEKFSKKYPNEKYPNDDGKLFRYMTYTDTLYTILFSAPKVVTKSAGKVKVKPVISDEMTADLIRCAGIMRRELEAERAGEK